MTRSGPTQATMARLFAQTPELTDWISCTTPPVRDGDYEFQYTDGTDHESPFFRALFDGHDWFDLEGKLLGWIKQNPEHYKWRGIRQWVLVRRDDPLCGCDVYVKRRSPGVTHFGGLERAIAFPTQAKAEAYRDRGRPFGDFAGIEAVMP